MTSVEKIDQSDFISLRERLSQDLNKELSEEEVLSLISQFSKNNYEDLVKQAKFKFDEEGFTQEKYEKALTFVIDDIEDTDISQKVDEILYGE